MTDPSVKTSRPLQARGDYSAQRRAIKALQDAGHAVETIEDVRALKPIDVLNTWNIGRVTFETIFGKGSWVRTVNGR